MKKIHLFACIFILMLFSCSDNRPAGDITGNWLVVYPDHSRLDDLQYKQYGKMQDSVIKLKGLKTITFKSDSTFHQTDSLFGEHGRWMVEGDRLALFGGGKGFAAFKGKIISRNDSMLLIRETVNKGTGNVPLIWNLKRIEDKRAGKLFDETGNWWRQKAAAPETEEALKLRVKAALEYYALYFQIVSEDATYFTPRRVFLPFRYYQHGVMLAPFDQPTHFNAMFYDTTQARQGYEIISTAIDHYEGRFPKGENYVIEYSMFLKKLATKVK